jgi:DUF2934 family protein
MGSDVTAELRRRWIAEAAYFRAQQRGFQGGDPLQDWLAAEAEVDRALAASAADAGRITITQQELDDLMARAREAQLELLAEALRIRMQASPQEQTLQGEDESSRAAWESLRDALRSIASDRR